jgi:hypothetical protein
LCVSGELRSFRWRDAGGLAAAAVEINTVEERVVDGLAIATNESLKRSF